MVTLSIRSPSSNTDFQVIVNSFLSDKGLPLGKRAAG